MKITLSFIRFFSLFLCLLFATAYTTTYFSGGFQFANLLAGLITGAVFWVGLLGIDQLFKGINTRLYNTAILGLLLGFLMGQAILLVLDNVIQLTHLPMGDTSTAMLKTAVYVFSTYLAMITIVRSSEELHLSIPFIKFQAVSQKKKDIVLDPTILTDSRIIDIAGSGLVDHQLILPRFVMKELYANIESPDESTKSKARRSLDVIKRLEAISTLDMRYTETDFPEIKDQTAKILRLARLLDANIVTSDISRIQQSSIESVEGIRIINLHSLANALKPLSQAGESITIKVQRYGKEPRQGVGYLDDGTMVVVNGGAEFIGETIKAHVLSVKHTTSGRMIFCNAADAPPMTEKEFAQTVANMESAHKNYFAL